MRYSPAAPKRRKKEGANSSDLAPLPVNKTGNTSFDLLVVRRQLATAHYIYTTPPSCTLAYLQEQCLCHRSREHKSKYLYFCKYLFSQGL
jgi:hypothetical protein